MSEAQEALEDYTVLVTIFSFLPVKELCLSAAGVCKRWHSVANDGLLWHRMVFRDFPDRAQFEGVEGAHFKGGWKEAWQRLRVKQFNPQQTHPSITLSEDNTTARRSVGTGGSWHMAMVQGTMDPAEEKLYYCEFHFIKGGSNWMVGAVDSSLDAKTKDQDCWGCTHEDGWMVVGNSANLAWGREYVSKPGWSNSHLQEGTKVGILLDARKLPDKHYPPGFRVWFYFDGELQPPAWSGINKKLCFAATMHDEGITIKIVRDAKLPLELPM